jgi:hypothetical protein
MKRILAISLAACLFISLLIPQVQDALAIFLIAGVIPGTAWVVPPTAMLAMAVVGLVLAVMLAHRHARTISLPPLETPKQKTAKKRAAANKTSVKRWRDALRPQLQLLQQKLIAFGRSCRRKALQLFSKFWQVALDARRAVRFPLLAFSIAEGLRKIASFITKK